MGWKVLEIQGLTCHDQAIRLMTPILLYAVGTEETSNGRPKDVQFGRGETFHILVAYIIEILNFEFYYLLPPVRG